MMPLAWAEVALTGALRSDTFRGYEKLAEEFEAWETDGLVVVPGILGFTRNLRSWRRRKGD